MAPFVEGLRARGIDATAIDLPKRKAEDALPAFHLVGPGATADVAVGGHSFGGRVASLAAAEPGGAVRGARAASATRSTRPARPNGRTPGSRTGRRSAARSCCCRASRIRSPGSTCCGGRRAAPATRELVTYPRLGHTLKPVLDDALDRAAAFLRAATGR